MVTNGPAAFHEDDYRLENQQLREALISARIIGAAIGILMERTKRTYDQAYEQLKQFSQDRNMKLRKVSDLIVFTGELPEQ